MCSRHSEPGAGDQPVTYRVPIRSQDSDHTLARLIRVYGPRDLEHQMEQLREDFPDYRLGTPRRVA